MLTIREAYAGEDGIYCRLTGYTPSLGRERPKFVEGKEYGPFATWPQAHEKLAQLTESELIEAGRAWLLDCYPSEDCQSDIEGASADVIRKAVARDYEGGWPQFVKDNDP